MDAHSNQMELVRINLTLLHLFGDNVITNLKFAYCPSHIGIEGNERADNLASREQPAQVGPVILKQHFVEEMWRRMNNLWRIRASSLAY